MAPSLQIVGLVGLMLATGSDNLLTNAEFDSDLAGWRPWGTTPTQRDSTGTRWSARDIKSADNSGSLEVSLQAPGISRGRLQCIRADAAETYRLDWCRGRVAGKDKELMAGIYLVMFSDDDCQRVLGMHGATEYVWSGWQCGSQQVQTWAGTRSLGVQLRGVRREGYSDGPAAVFFDRVRLRKIDVP